MILKSQILSLDPVQGLESYSHFVKNCYKLKTSDEIPDKNIRFYSNENIKKLQSEKLSSFLDEGNPGQVLTPKYEKILKNLKVPTITMEEINKENSPYEDFYKDLYGNGYMFIIPSFFKFMIDLQKKDRKFVIIFRTFGTDFDNIIKEYNSFCEGNHPIFNGKKPEFPKCYFNGEHGSKDYRIKENKKNKTIGLFYRFGSDVNDIYLVLGDLKRVKVDSSEELYKNFE